MLWYAFVIATQPDYPLSSAAAFPTIDFGERKAFDDPRIVVEMVSAIAARTDLRVKLPEYNALRTIDTIVFVDIAVERLPIVQRTATGLNEVVPEEAMDLPLPAIDLIIPHDEIFARD